MASAVSVRKVVLQLNIEVAQRATKGDLPTYGILPPLRMEGREHEVVVDGKGHAIFVVGRETDDIKINDPFQTVSPKHGFFLFRDGKFYYFDNESTNGSVVNGARLRSTPNNRMPGVAMKEGKKIIIELGQWNPKQNTTERVPVVKIVCELVEQVQTARPVAAAEVQVTILLQPTGMTTQDFYLLQGLSNDHASLSKVTRSGPADPATADKILIGRGVDKKHVRIPSLQQTTMGVSNTHGAIVFHEGVFLYEDLGSTNGSVVNGELIRSKSKVLREGYNSIALGAKREEKHPVFIELTIHRVTTVAETLPIPETVFRAEKRAA